MQILLMLLSFLVSIAIMVHRLSFFIAATVRHYGNVSKISEKATLSEKVHANGVRNKQYNNCRDCCCSSPPFFSSTELHNNHQSPRAIKPPSFVLISTRSSAIFACLRFFDAVFFLQFFILLMFCKKAVYKFLNSFVFVLHV